MNKKEVLSCIDRSKKYPYDYKEKKDKDGNIVNAFKTDVDWSVIASRAVLEALTDRFGNAIEDVYYSDAVEIVNEISKIIKEVVKQEYKNN